MLYCIVPAIIIVVATITTKHIWSFHNGVDDAFFFVKASCGCGCGGRWSIPSSNWIIDDEEAIGFIEFVVIIIIVIFNGNCIVIVV